MRKLVTVRQITAIDPIPNADAIEVVTVDGWKVVAKKGEYSLGQWVVYFEIDSVLPKGRPEFEFLMVRGCKEHHCEDNTFLQGHRLRTIKLRGQFSQGLVIPIPEAWSLFVDTATKAPTVIIPDPENDAEAWSKSEEDDLAFAFGVKKYEAVIPAALAGQTRRAYPNWLPKTDQERIQNCKEVLELNTLWTIEEKLEGSSMTIYHDGESAGVTSRNLDLKLDQEGNTFVDVAKSSGLLEAIEALVTEWPHIHKVAVRGELLGPGIQGNIYNLKSHCFYVFDVFVATTSSPGGAYLTSAARDSFMNYMLANADYVKWDKVVFQVPIIRLGVDLRGLSVDTIVEMADGESRLFPTQREGLVFKSETEINGHVVSFKSISPVYLLNEK